MSGSKNHMESREKENVSNSSSGTTHLELLLFSLGQDNKTGRDELFGVNVFKVREIIPIPEITHAPDMPDGVVGLVSIRKEIIPVLDLQKICNINTDTKPQIMIITEYNNHVHGFLVHKVESIHRLSWKEMREPPPLLIKKMGGLVTAVSELKDKRLMMLLDVEKILTELSDEDTHCGYQLVEKIGISSDKKIFFVDDSSVARKQIARTLDKMGLKYLFGENGKIAWQQLDRLAQEAENRGNKLSDNINAILTDIEMPELDGYELTKKIKTDPRFTNIPVLLHSSLTSKSNAALGLSTGADDYIGKFEPQELAKVIAKHVK